MRETKDRNEQITQVAVTPEKCIPTSEGKHSTAYSCESMNTTLAGHHGETVFKIL